MLSNSLERQNQAQKSDNFYENLFGATEEIDNARYVRYFFWKLAI
jgi:hypothetical protein